MLVWISIVCICLVSGSLLKMWSDRKYLVTETFERVPNANYKFLGELTEDDLLMIEMDRDATGIGYYSDEYYYNNILFYNYEV